MMHKSKGMPWDDPFSDPPTCKVLWDYTTNTIVGEGHVPSLFDTYWTYSCNPDSPFTWTLCRYPGDTVYLNVRDVPEIVQLAIMVTE